MAESKKFTDRCSADMAFRELGRDAKGEGLQGLYKEIKGLLEKYYESDLLISQSFSSGSIPKKYCYYQGVKYDKYGLTWDEALRSMVAVFNDCPAFYFIDKYYIAGDSKVSIVTPVVDYEFIRPEFRKFYAGAIEREIAAIARKVNVPDDPRATAKNAYDHICRTSTYDRLKGNAEFTRYVDIPSHSVLGYVRNRSAVCEGFAETYQMLMNYLGIPAISVSGMLYNDDAMTVSGGSHRRNFIYLPDEGRWIMVDVTVGISSGDSGFDIPLKHIRFRPLKDNEKYTQNHYYAPAFEEVWNSWNAEQRK